MHGEIDRAGKQRLLDLLGEQSLAADIGKPPVLHPVAGGADGHDLKRAGRAEAGMGRDQLVAHARGLDQRHRTAAGPDAQRRGQRGHFLEVLVRADAPAHGFSSSLPITAPASSS
jgi:hypothetical protein